MQARAPAVHSKTSPPLTLVLPPKSLLLPGVLPCSGALRKNRQVFNVPRGPFSGRQKLTQNCCTCAREAAQKNTSELCISSFGKKKTIGLNVPVASSFPLFQNFAENQQMGCKIELFPNDGVWKQKRAFVVNRPSNSPGTNEPLYEGQ